MLLSDGISEGIDGKTDKWDGNASAKWPGMVRFGEAQERWAGGTRACVRGSRLAAWPVSAGTAQPEPWPVVVASLRGDTGKCETGSAICSHEDECLVGPPQTASSVLPAQPQQDKPALAFREKQSLMKGLLIRHGQRTEKPIRKAPWATNSWASLPALVWEGWREGGDRSFWARPHGRR